MTVSTARRAARAAGAPSHGADDVPARRGRPRISRPDQLALAFLVLLPVLLDVSPALAGHTLLPGDDLTQNYPLRLLAGDLIRSGHLPGWDPFIWSGTPLLAGWNAGALFPGTWLFAVLPGAAAWTANLVAVGVVSGTGTFLLLRRLRCGPVASVLGALSFTYTGFMSGQVVHIGLVQGTALMPWMLLAVDVLATPSVKGVLTTRHATLKGARELESPPAWRPTRREVRWTLLLGIAGALTVLAGDPRAVSSSAIAVGLYALACLWRSGRTAGASTSRAAGALALRVGGAAALGAALSAAQWLPGLTFLHASQRGVSAYTFFSGGSLTLTEIGTLLELPFALGGNGNFGLATYSGNYNLPEVTIGVGLVALVATFAQLPSALAALRPRRGSRGARRARDASVPASGHETHRRLGIWYLTGVAGVVLTLGSNSPLGHLLVHIPLYGGERLQNRNVVLVDLALVVLLAFFVDDLLAGRSTRAGPAAMGTSRSPSPDGAARSPAPGPNAGPLGTPTRRALALAPLVALVGLIALALLAPVTLENAIGVVIASPGMMRPLTPYLIASGVLGCALAALVATWRRSGRRTRHVLLAAFVVADVATYATNASYASAPAGALSSDGAGSASLRGLTGPNGRFAIYNPLYGGTGTAVYALGVTDLNVLRRIASVQGYGSIVQGAYQNATDTHTFEALDQSRLPGPTFDVLDLATLVTLPQYLDQPLPERSAIPLAGGDAVRASGDEVPARDAPARPPGASGPWAVAARSPASWFLAGVTRVSSVTVVLQPGHAASPLRLGVGLAAPGRRVRWSTARVTHGIATLRPARATTSDRVLVRSPHGVATVGAVVVGTRAPRARLLLDGELQGLIRPPHWQFAGTIGTLVAFTNTRARGAAWLEDAAAVSPDGPVAHAGTVSLSTTASTGAAVVHVTTPRAALLVRSETFARGWTARLTPVGGGWSRVEPVSRLGLVQATLVPAGRYVVTWRYAPASLVAGLVISAASAAATVVLLALCVERRRSRRGRVRHHAEQGASR
ncbi:MAG TPA: hypothetical protein VND23_04570 [Acidimicrobiales bacterium]|nr:hypothetical protein [Acidimicrobiales bacterium]